MALTAIDPQKTVDYILEEDKNSDNPTIFKLKILSAREWSHAQDALRSKEEETEVEMGKYFYTLLRYGLAGWENFIDTEGHSIKFRKRGDGSHLDILKPEWRNEIAIKIAEINTTTEEEEKN